MCTAMQELKKKEMEELDAVFAQFGIEAKADEQAEGAKKKKNRKKVQAEGGAEASVSKPEPAAADSEESEDEENGAPVDPAVVRPRTLCRNCGMTKFAAVIAAASLQKVQPHNPFIDLPSPTGQGPTCREDKEG